MPEIYITTYNRYMYIVPNTIVLGIMELCYTMYMYMYMYVQCYVVCGLCMQC